MLIVVQFILHVTRSGLAFFLVTQLKTLVFVLEVINNSKPVSCQIKMLVLKKVAPSDNKRRIEHKFKSTDQHAMV